ncbi:hypothetical protein, partial [Escherichia coli]|uniref:hypothetical protein n=1 Tax=Escherichia coli TaxID=562 RepID=UPI001BB29CC3
ISVKTGNNARNGGKNSLNRLIRCVCGKKIGPDPRNFNQRVSLGRNDLLIRTFLRFFTNLGKIRTSCNSTQINLKYRFINSNFTDL